MSVALDPEIVEPTGISQNRRINMYCGYCIHTVHSAQYVNTADTLVTVRTVRSVHTVHIVHTVLNVHTVHTVHAVHSVPYRIPYRTIPSMLCMYNTQSLVPSSLVHGT